MSLNVFRVYKNAAGDVLRTDTLSWVATSNPLNTGVAHRTYARQTKTRVTVDSSIADRTVAAIVLITDAGTVDTVNYASVTWARSTGNVIGDMSDLPIITDTV